MDPQINKLEKDPVPRKDKSRRESLPLCPNYVLKNMKCTLHTPGCESLSTIYMGKKEK